MMEAYLHWKNIRKENRAVLSKFKSIKVGANIPGTDQSNQPSLYIDGTLFVCLIIGPSKFELFHYDKNTPKFHLLKDVWDDLPEQFRIEAAFHLDLFA